MKWIQFHFLFYTLKSTIKQYNFFLINRKPSETTARTGWISCVSPLPDFPSKNTAGEFFEAGRCFLSCLFLFLSFLLWRVTASSCFSQEIRINDTNRFHSAVNQWGEEQGAARTAWNGSSAFMTVLSRVTSSARLPWRCPLACGCWNPLIPPKTLAQRRVWTGLRGFWTIRVFHVHAGGCLIVHLQLKTFLFLFF